LTRRLADAAPVTAPLLGGMCMSRAAPEIATAAMRRPADLYIAHNVTVLTAAIRAAKTHQALVGYDAEDFYSGMSPLGDSCCAEDRRIEGIERRWLYACDYMTAAAPAIADEYVTKFGIARPVPVLNTFPLADRPAMFRPTTATGNLRLYWFSQVIGAGRGLEDVVRAMGLLKDLKIELHLRGGWQRGYKDRLLALTAECAVSSQVHRHEPASPDDMVRSAAQYDIGLALEQLVTKNDDLRLTNKILTYLLAGNAIVGTRTPAQENFIASLGGVGVTYQQGNVEALAAQLQKWHLDRSSLDAVRRRAWDWGQRRYNWDIEKQHFLSTVESACCKHFAASATR